jgi:hypothetical protein
MSPQYDGEASSIFGAAADFALTHGLTAYDAACVAAAGARLVSCDARDLVFRGLAELPADAVAQIRPALGE